jgi:hypothetical protein
LKYFEEAYTTENWIVRIYRVKDKSSLRDLEYNNENIQDVGVQALSGLSESQASNPHAQTRFAIKNTL